MSYIAGRSSRRERRSLLSQMACQPGNFLSLLLYECQRGNSTPSLEQHYCIHAQAADIGNGSLNFGACRVAEMMVSKSTVEDAIAFIKELEESLDIQIG